MSRNRALAREARDLLCSVLAAPPPCPPSWLGALASVPLPAGAPGSPAARLDADGLSGWFRERGIETWLHPWAGGRVIRVSAQLYNSLEQFEALAAALGEALG
jgi:isopenicillin-N epimerase